MCSRAIGQFEGRLKSAPIGLVAQAFLRAGAIATDDIINNIISECLAFRDCEERDGFSTGYFELL